MDREWQATMPLTKVAGFPIVKEVLRNGGQYLRIVQENVIWGGKGQGSGVRPTIGRDVRDESSEGSGEAVMPYCPADGEPREVREPKLNGDGGLNAKVLLIKEVGVWPKSEEGSRDRS